MITVESGQGVEVVYALAMSVVVVCALTDGVTIGTTSRQVDIEVLEVTTKVGTVEQITVDEVIV